MSVCRRLAAFIDIEAEASDDDEEEEEDESGDDVDGEEEAREADAMFVNDGSPASIRSQPERGYANIDPFVLTMCFCILSAKLACCHESEQHAHWLHACHALFAYLTVSRTYGTVCTAQALAAQDWCS